MEILNFKGPLLDLIHILKKGGSIHIKKKNRGKFTDYCGGKVTEECIAKGKKSKDPKIRKRATFAANARKWKHENGGILKAQEGTGNLYTPHPLSPVGIALNQAKAMAKSKKDQPYLLPGVKEVELENGQKAVIRTETPLKPITGAAILPGIGDVVEVGQIGDDIKNGNYGMAIAGAGLLAIPGNASAVMRKLPAVDKIRDKQLRETVEFLNNFGVDKIKFETYLELDDALRYSDIGLKGDKARIKKAVERVRQDIKDYMDNAAASMKKTSKKAKPTDS